MIKKIKILLFLVFLMPIIVNAECSIEDEIRLENLSNNITSSYTFDEVNQTFTITFTNLNSDLLLKDIDNNKIYSLNGELSIKKTTSGEHQFYIFDKSEECSSIKLKVISVELPYYNKYYKNEKCNDFYDKYYCNKWLKTDVSYDEWKTNVDTYKTDKKEEKQETKTEEKVNNNLFDLIKKYILIASSYYYIILPAIIVIYIIAAYIKDKKDSLF